MRTICLLTAFAFACSKSADTPPEGGVGEGDGGVDSAPPDGSAVDASATIDAQPPSISPATLFGSSLTLWLDASEPSTVVLGDGGAVQQWKDRSSEKHEVFAYSPSGGTIAIEHGVLNGRSAMKFRGGSSLASASQTTGVFAVHRDSSNSDFTLIFVVAYRNVTETYLYYPTVNALNESASGPGNRWIVANLDSSSSTHPNVGRLAGGISNAFGGKPVAQTLAAGWNDGRFHVVSFRRDNAERAVFLRVDGSDTRSDVEIDPTIAVREGYAQIGGASERPATGTSGIAYALDGMVAEVIEVKSLLSPDQSVGLTTYLNDKYALKY